MEQREADLRDAANEAPNFIEATKLNRRADQIDEQLMYQGANPKKVPFKDLRDHIRSPVASEDGVTNGYRAKIKNRATGIRAYCVGCMGGELVGVRECLSVTCPLHPFRMGKDPFRGFELPEVADIEIEDDGADEFEDGDDFEDNDDE